MFPFKIVKTSAALALAAAIFASSTPAYAAYSSSVSASTKLVYASGKNFTVNVVTVDLTDPTLDLVPALADGGIGHDDAMQSIVERENGVAAINGTFFNAYESDPYIRYPNGTLLKSGEAMHSGENQTFFLNKDKIPDIEYVNLDIAVRTSEGGGTYTINPWGINKYYGDTSTDQIVWYTPDFGRWIGFSNGTKIVISDGLVTRITQDSVAVPADGYVLFVGNSANNKQNVLSKLDVGDRITKELITRGEGGSNLDAKTWLAAIGVGPKLVTNDTADINVKRDGFSDPKVTSSSTARSFVGINGSNRLVMGTVPSATLSELANITIALGLKEAMNMDGGSTVVPIRPFITAMNAKFAWDAATRTATITNAGVTMKLQDGSSNATVNGKSVSVPVPLQIMDDSKMYVPLRLVAESLKGTVTWNSSLYRASVKLP